MSDFDRFKRACLGWQKRLGLLDWRLVFRSTEGAPDGPMSTVYCDNEARVATLDWPKKAGRNLPIDTIAKHEMLHVLLNDFAKMVAARGDDMHKDAIREEHKLIERIIGRLS